MRNSSAGWGSGHCSCWHSEAVHRALIPQVRAARAAVLPIRLAVLPRRAGTPAAAWAESRPATRALLTRQEPLARTAPSATLAVQARVTLEVLQVRHLSPAAGVPRVLEVAPVAGATPAVGAAQGVAARAACQRRLVLSLVNALAACALEV